MANNKATNSKEVSYRDVVPYGVIPKGRAAGISLDAARLCETGTKDLASVKIIHVPAAVKTDHRRSGREFPILWEFGGQQDDSRGSHCMIIGSKTGGIVPSSEVVKVIHGQKNPNSRHAQIEIGRGTIFAVGHSRQTDESILVYRVTNISQLDPALVAQMVAEADEQRNVIGDVADLTCELIGYSISTWRGQNVKSEPEGERLIKLVSQKLSRPSYTTINVECWWQIKKTADREAIYNSESFKNGTHLVMAKTVDSDRFLSHVTQGILNYRQELFTHYNEVKNSKKSEAGARNTADAEVMAASNHLNNALAVRQDLSIEEDGKIKMRLSVICALKKSDATEAGSEDDDNEGLPLVFETTFMDSIPEELLSEPSLIHHKSNFEELSAFIKSELEKPDNQLSEELMFMFQSNR